MQVDDVDIDEVQCILANLIYMVCADHLLSGPSTLQTVKNTRLRIKVYYKKHISNPRFSSVKNVASLVPKEFSFDIRASSSSRLCCRVQL